MQQHNVQDLYLWGACFASLQTMQYQMLLVASVIAHNTIAGGVAVLQCACHVFKTSYTVQATVCSLRHLYHTVLLAGT